MDKIQVDFLSTLSIFTREKRVEIPIPEGSNIRAVLQILHQKYGKEQGARIFDYHGALSPVLVILLNGTDIRRLDGVDTLLTNGDVVVFLPVIAGG
jgi:MoaD family protein